MKKLLSVMIAAMLALTLFTNAVALNITPVNEAEHAHIHASESLGGALASDEIAQPDEITGSPVRVSASKIYINPLDVGRVTEDDFIVTEPSPYIAQFGDVNAVGQYIRSQFIARSSTISAGLTAYGVTDDKLQAMLEDVVEAALEHTGVPNEGDYLRYHIDFKIEVGGYSYPDGHAELVFNVYPEYKTTAAQEKTVDARVAALIKSLDLDGKSDYEKIYEVYKWICDNVTYDYTHLNDSSHLLKYTAYAALVNKTAVCQGYANLFYRLMLELGIDSRIISGDGGGPHAWNIVKLGGYYYNVDSTWDAGKPYYSYFLKCNAHFYGHTRDSEYNTSAFNYKYPMSPTDYDAFAHDHVRGTERVGAKEADCIHEAYTGEIVCIVEGCDYVFEYGKYSAPLDHTYADGVCTVCGETEHMHKYIAGWGIRVDDNEHRIECYICGYTLREKHSPDHSGGSNCYACRYPMSFVPGSHDQYLTIINAVEPTCEEYGYTGDTYCTVCERVVDTGYPINPLFHDTDRDTVVCRRCGKCLHDMHWEERVMPTCTEDGYIGAYCCAVCGYVYIERDVLPALGHEFEDGYCSRCGECDHIIPDEPTGGYDPTCTEKGYEGDYICERCGEVAKKGEEIPARGHDYNENDICTRCGSEKPQYIPGDVNGDGEVDSIDSVMLMRYLVGIKVEGFIEAAADLNNDDSVDSLDSVLLLRYLVGL